MKKTIFTAIIAVFLMASTVFGGSADSGALTSATQVAEGQGLLMYVMCIPDGTNACVCTIYDGVGVVTRTLPGAYADAGTTIVGGWMANIDAAPVYGVGLYVVPSSNSTCRAGYVKGVK
jgi:hypothetical protein